MDPQPNEQALGNAYALRTVLRSIPGLGHLRVEYAIAFPHAERIAGALPPNLRPAQVLTADALADPAGAIDLLMARWGGGDLGDAMVTAIVATLCPDADFVWDVDARAARARRRMESICRDQVRALERLDMNRSVLVTGGPGTGKTRLAMSWATRAVVRGERTLLTCFNVPLAGEMRARLSGHELLTVDAFHEAMRSLPGMPPLEQPDDAATGWWERELVDHVAAHLGEVAIRFDTVVVDEAQDFDPRWLDLLDQLLDPDGPRRRLRVGDPSQLLYERGFTLPEADDGWTRCELAYNCRNTFDIAQLLRRHLAGAATPIAGPPAVELCGVAAESLDHVVELVGEEIDRLDDADRRPDRVLVATFHRAERDRLRDELGFVEWEAGNPQAVVCETVHRVKGLEFDHVILATADPAMPDALLAVGVSRAISGLTVIAPATVGRRLGLVED